MNACYKAAKLAKRSMNRITRLTYKMLSGARLNAKAAESRYLLDMLPGLFNEFKSLFGVNSRHLGVAISSLIECVKVMNNEPRVMSPVGLEKLQSSMLAFLCAWKRFGGHQVFKHHMCVHLVHNAERLGNPRCYWTYPDEEENRKMTNVAQKLHKGSTFYIRFLLRVLPEAL